VSRAGITFYERIDTGVVAIDRDASVFIRQRECEHGFSLGEQSSSSGF
jgi:hypothetical protein